MTGVCEMDQEPICFFDEDKDEHTKGEAPTEIASVSSYGFSVGTSGSAKYSTMVPPTVDFDGMMNLNHAKEKTRIADIQKDHKPSPESGAHEESSMTPMTYRIPLIFFTLFLICWQLNGTIDQHVITLDNVNNTGTLNVSINNNYNDATILIVVALMVLVANGTLTLKVEVNQ